jgi:hypothetical protein
LEYARLSFAETTSEFTWPNPSAEAIHRQFGIRAVHITADPARLPVGRSTDDDTRGSHAGGVHRLGAGLVRTRNSIGTVRSLRSHVVKAAPVNSRTSNAKSLVSGTAETRC